MKKYYKVLNNQESNIIERLKNIKIIGNIYSGIPRQIFDNYQAVEIEVTEEKIYLSIDSVQEINLNLSEKQIDALFAELTSLIMIRENYELLMTFGKSSFKEYIEECKKIYIEESEEEPFYEYIQNNLYSLACYDV